jgi:hypothetical protein
MPIIQQIVFPFFSPMSPSNRVVEELSVTLRESTILSKKVVGATV